jgi:hypothetical protein
MPKLAGRRVYLVALAVPIAMVIAPMTASAEGPDEAVTTEQASTAAVATDDAAAAEASATTTDEESDTFSPGPDWYPTDNVSVANYDPDDNAVTYVINGIHNDSVAGNYENEDENNSYEYEVNDAAAEGPDIDLVDHDVVENDIDVNDVDEDEVVENDVVDDDDVTDVDGMYYMDEDDSAAANYSDVTAAAGPDGAWVNSTEAGAVIGDNGWGHSYGDDNVTGAYYDELTAAAGSHGAYVESVESGAGEFADHDGYADFGDDDVTGAYHEEFSAGAGDGGAWTQGIESGAVDLD